MRKWNKRYVELTVEEMEKKDIPLVLVGAANLDRTYKGRDKATIKIYPITLVNLLGKYGDFETDVNGDGLADGWSHWNGSNHSLASGIINSYSQKFWQRTDGSNWTIYRGGTTTQANHKLFIILYEKLYTDIENYTGSFGIIYFNFPDWSHNRISFRAPFDNTWHKLYGTVIPELDNYHIELTLATGVADANTYGYVDGIAIYDLTLMGELNPVMKQIYGVNNWSDLDADTLAELLPFVNSLQTLGYMIWEDL